MRADRPSPVDGVRSGRSPRTIEYRIGVRARTGKNSPRRHRRKYGVQSRPRTRATTCRASVRFSSIVFYATLCVYVRFFFRKKFSFSNSLLLPSLPSPFVACGIFFAPKNRTLCPRDASLSQFYSAERPFNSSDSRYSLIVVVSFKNRKSSV